MAADQLQSYDHVRRWKEEIQTVESEKPIILVLTKSDLDETQEDDLVDLAMLREKSRLEGLQGAMKTSAKNSNDLSVQLAFERILTTAFEHKYGDD